MKKTIWIVVWVGVLLAVGWFVWHRHETPTVTAGGGHGGGRRHGGGMDANQPVPVVAGTVERKDVPIFLDGLGTVQAYNTVTVRARVDGQLDKVAFTEGQTVKVGDLLAQIDPRPYQAQLDQAVAKKAQDTALLANAQTVLKRDEDLLAKKVLDQQTYETQKYTADQLVATVNGDQAAIENAQTQLDYTRITAPLAGRVGIRLVDQGNIVHASDTGGIVVITQLQPISVVFTLPEQTFPAIRENYPEDPEKNPMVVYAYGRDKTNFLGQGALAVIDNQIDTTTGTIKLKATFPNEDLRMWPGEFVGAARLLLNTRKGGLVVPAPVIQRGPQGSYAFVIKPDLTVEARTVKVAQTEDNLALIDDGLQAGEKVVVDGQYKLQDGSKVVISNAPGSGGQANPPHDGSGHRSRPQTAKRDDPSPTPRAAEKS